MSGETLTTIVAIFLAAMLIGIFPMMAIADRNDDISQVSAQVSVTEFVDTIRKTGKITIEDYESLVVTLYATGNTYDIDMEVQVLDENPSKKTTQSDETKIGENIYFSEYTSQIMSELESKGVKTLKEGDKITVTVSNTNTTIAQSLKNFFYSLTGNNTYSIVASQTRVVAVNGSN